MSRAKNFNLDAIHQFGIWISRFEGRGKITWVKRVLAEDELQLLKEKFSLLFEKLYRRFSGKSLEGFEDVGSLGVRDFSVGKEKFNFGSMGEFEKGDVEDLEKLIVKNIGGALEWQEKKIEKLDLRNMRDATF